jgi:hypothetical protein
MFFILLFAFTLVFCSVAAAANTNYTYTTDDDFNRGNGTGLNVSDNRLQLSSNSSASSYSFIWVPNSNEGTVSKVNTVTGLEVARYRVGPSAGSSPSRTTIDLDGNCWVGNRGTGTVVKIGLFENGGYFDRNNNGIIETCRDLDGNGVITADEILPGVKMNVYYGKWWLYQDVKVPIGREIILKDILMFLDPGGLLLIVKTIYGQVLTAHINFTILMALMVKY